MYDPDTEKILQDAPPLEGLDLDRLPTLLTRIYADIVTTRMRLRGEEGGAATSEWLEEQQQLMGRLAATLEAFVVARPERQDRRSAAFVAASAHQVRFRIDRILGGRRAPSFLDEHRISPNVAATLLFMIAESPADAMEAASLLDARGEDSSASALISGIRGLAFGELNVLADRVVPRVAQDAQDTVATATLQLWAHLLAGLRGLARELLGNRSGLRSIRRGQEQNSQARFQEVKDIAATWWQFDSPYATINLPVYLTGPHHLASLLALAARDLLEIGIVNVSSPPSVEEEGWQDLLKKVSRRRPYLWQNHREVLDAGFLDLQNSAVLNFPTGSGKSILSELKVATYLLCEKKVLVLAPTHSLVDQWRRQLQATFSNFNVEQSTVEEDVFVTETLPDISVMTPEQCLAALSFNQEQFNEVGLLVFDECHLMHPKEQTTDRRSVDAMLCLLNFIVTCPSASVLLISAMVRNADELASWLETATLGRRCITGSSPWKPTRQARGCVVYEREEVDALERWLADAPRTRTGRPTAQARRDAAARPYGLFSLRQTWDTNAWSDYALLNLRAEQIGLGIGVRERDGKFYPTANVNQVAASVAAGACTTGIKSLIFVGTRVAAGAVAEKLNMNTAAVAHELDDEDERLFEYSLSEVGQPEALYITKSGLAAAHHGLLLQSERWYNERLFRRQDGFQALAATSTLSQGMNLPSELVIIAGDRRFEQELGKQERLKAHEILNAAGRAGRAGEASHGLVIVVPSRIIPIDSKRLRIARGWAELKSIFAQSDQCLSVQDPLGAVLDRIQASEDGAIGELDAYALRRLGFYETEEGNMGRRYLERSLAAFLARKQGDDNWVERCMAAVVRWAGDEANHEAETTWQARLARIFGVDLKVIEMIADTCPPREMIEEMAIEDWITLLADWSFANRGAFGQLTRASHDLLGMHKESEEELDMDRRQLEELLLAWVQGEQLMSIQRLIPKGRRVAKCDDARKFALNAIPDLSFVASVFARVASEKRRATEGNERLPLMADKIGQCIRLGFDVVEKLALYYVLQKIWSRVQVHRKFGEIRGAIPPGLMYDTLRDAQDRVSDAWFAQDR